MSTTYYASNPLINILRFGSDLLTAPPPPPPATFNPGFLDQGSPFPKRIVTLGPTVGIQEQYIIPQVTVNASQTLPTFCTVVLVGIAGITLTLPNLVQWLQQLRQPYFINHQRRIWIKDMSGHAATSPITILPNPSDSPASKIDNQASKSLNVNFGILRIYPLLAGGGWYVG